MSESEYLPLNTERRTPRMLERALHESSSGRPPRAIYQSPSRRFLAMQLPTTSAAEASLYENTAPANVVSGFRGSCELDVSELTKRLRLIHEPSNMPHGCFGDMVRKGSRKSGKRDYECSVFEVVDLGPSTMVDCGKDAALAPAAIHRVSIRKRPPNGDKNKNRVSNIQDRNSEDTRQSILCCCSVFRQKKNPDSSLRVDDETYRKAPEGCEDSKPRAPRRLVKEVFSSSNPEIRNVSNEPRERGRRASDVFAGARRRLSKVTQFFESINLQADFEDEDALQNYLYDRSQKIHPKNEADRPPEVKPKRPPHVLRSPGIKPPKHSTQANHYSPSSSNQLTSGSGTVPSTPSPREHGPRSAVPYVKSPTEDAHFALVDIQPGQHPKYLGDVSRRQAVASTSGQSPIGPLGPVPKKVLAPPPLHPRRNRPSNLTSPPPRSPLGAPPLFPRRQTISPPSANAGSSHAKSPRLSAAAQPQTFVFPDLSMPAVTASPPLPPRIREQQTSPCSSAEHRVILPVPDSTTPRDDHSPTVSVSLQLPPQLPPPRVRHSAAAPPLPPPRPPKPSRYSTSPRETTPAANSTSGTPPPAVSPPAPEEAPVPPTLDVPAEGAPAPPPLPPKTYKGRKQSSSPTS